MRTEIKLTENKSLIFDGENGSSDFRIRQYKELETGSYFVEDKTRHTFATYETALLYIEIADSKDFFTFRFLDKSLYGKVLEGKAIITGDVITYTSINEWRP